MNEHIKELRKVLKLTQQGFADRLGVKRNTVAQWEIGVNNLSAQVVRAICREFNVNETWLRTGKGEIFIRTPSNTLDTLAKEYGLSHDARVLVEEFVNLKPEMQQVFIDFALKAAKSFCSEPSAPAALVETEDTPPDIPVKAPQEMTDEELHAELDRQLSEEKKQAASE